MQAIIIGAGRGQRLMPTTADTPKCFAEVRGRRILDWTLAALGANGIDRIAFIGGYQIDKVRAAYPELTFRHNADWANNNILASLFCAEDLMGGPFLCSYSDILFTPEVVRLTLASTDDMALVVDTDWKRRYAERTEHPPDDAEKVLVKGARVTRVARDIVVEQAHGEYIGVAKFSAAGTARLRQHYRRCREKYAGKPFREARAFEKAYLIQLFQDMIEAGERFAHVDTPGGYIEVDTQQDFEYARQNWGGP
jgi:choline kinase